MKLALIRTANGFVCADNDALDNARKLQLGVEYQAEVKIPRNYEFLKKYFALIACAWEYLPEDKQRGFGNKESFRKAVEVAAGHFELFYSFQRREWLQVPSSVSFDKLKEDEFQDLYVNVRTVIDAIVQNYVSPEEFEKTLLHF